MATGIKPYRSGPACETPYVCIRLCMRQAGMSSCQQLERQGIQGPDTGQTWVSKTRHWWDQYCMYVYSAHIFHKWDFILINQRGEQDEATVVSVSAVFSVCANLCHQPCTYACMYCVYKHMCAYQEQTLNLATAWVRGHGAAAASPLSGDICRIILTTRRMFNITKTFFKPSKHDGLKQKFN